MNDQPEPLPPANVSVPPGKPAPQKTLPKIVWLFEAIIPSVLALGMMQITPIDQSLGKALLILTLICSLVAGIGLVSGMRSRALRVILSIFLMGFLFIANMVVFILIGCSQTDRTSPWS